MKYRVFMKVHATAIVDVEADSEAEAMDKARDEFSESNIGICHQCSDEISDPTYGEPVEAVETEDDL